MVMSIVEKFTCLVNLSGGCADIQWLEVLGLIVQICC